MKTLRLIAAALLGAAAIVASGPDAGAHEEVPGVSSVVDSIQPALPAGVKVQTLVSVADQMVVENRTDTELVVLGDAGEPFLRIGPGGVHANLNSPTWYRSNDPTGTATPPERADPKAEPVFARASKEPTWGWFDHRLHRRALAGAPAVDDADKPVRLEEWEIPMRYGSTAVLVKGHREYRFPPGAFAADVVSTPAGVKVAALGGGSVPLLALTATAASTQNVTVLGEGGEPMARLTPTGLEVNEASPTWVFTAESKGGYRRVEPVGAGEPPRWVKSGGNQLSWLERRAQVVTPDGIGRPGQRKTWTVPVLVGDTAGAIEGVTTWVSSKLPERPVPEVEVKGPSEGDGWPVQVALGAVGAAAVVGVYFGVARLRRRRAG